MAMTFTHWQDGDVYLGYLNAYPEYPTQGQTLEEVKSMLNDIYGAIRDGDLADTAANRHSDTLGKAGFNRIGQDRQPTP